MVEGQEAVLMIVALRKRVVLVQAMVVEEEEWATMEDKSV